MRNSVKTTYNTDLGDSGSQKSRTAPTATMAEMIRRCQCQSRSVQARPAICAGLSKRIISTFKCCKKKLPLRSLPKGYYIMLYKIFLSTFGTRVLKGFAPYNFFVDTATMFTSLPSLIVLLLWVCQVKTLHILTSHFR